MNATTIRDLVTTEVTTLHKEFESWFRAESESLARVDAALAADFLFVSPRGDLVSRAALMANLAKNRGTGPAAIRIRDTTVHWVLAGTVLATYQEWHDHPDYTTVRLSSVVFTTDETAPGGLLWRHVHETWMTPPPTWTIPPPR